MSSAPVTVGGVSRVRTSPSRDRPPCAPPTRRATRRWSSPTASPRSRCPSARRSRCWRGPAAAADRTPRSRCSPRPACSPSAWSARAGSSRATGAGCPRRSTPTRTRACAGWRPRRRTTSGRPARPSPRCATWSRPWSTRCPAARRAAASTTFRRRLDAELVRPRRTPDGGASLPALVTISLRVEADEEELVAGSVRLVLQVHDELDALHLCDAALLWTGTSEDHGFGERARTHAAIALAGRRPRLAGARPAARAARARRDHPRHRRAGLAPRRRGGRAAPGRRRRAVAAQPRPRPDDPGRARAPRRAADRRAR